MGLLDFMNTDDARFGINLLAAASPTMQPMGFGGRLALAMRMNDEQRQRSLEEQMRKEQMRLISQKADREQRLQEFMANRLQFGAAQPQAGVIGQQAVQTQGSIPQQGGAPVTMQQGPNGGFPFGLNDIAALNVMGAPGADKLLDMYKYANDGSKREAGNYYVNPMTGQTTFMPKIPEGATITQDGRIVPMPGAADTNAAYKGAEAQATERAKAGYADPVVLKGAAAGGADVIIPRSNVPGFNGTLTTPSPIGLKGQEAFNKNWIDNTYKPVQESGNNAQELAGQVQTLRNIPINTGWGAEAISAGANMLTGLGVAPENAKMFATNSQKFQQVASERLWTVLNSAKGPQTEGDADRAKQTFAKLSNTPAANAFILDLAEANARRDQLRANYYQDAYSLVKDSGEYSKVDQEWRKVQRSIWDDPIMQKWKVQQ